MDTFDIILIGLLIVVVFMNFCGKMYKRHKYRSELLEGLEKETDRNQGLGGKLNKYGLSKKVKSSDFKVSDLDDSQLGDEKVRGQLLKKIAEQTQPPSDDSVKLVMDTNELPDVRVNAIKDMTTGGLLVDDLPASADSVGKAYITLGGGDSKPSVVQGVRDATELEFRQAYKMDDISPMPLVIPYQQLVFGKNIVVPPADPRMDTRQPRRMGGGKGSVKVQMVWADWCGYSNKAKEAWPKMQQIVGNSHLGVSIDYEDILEKENKELVARLKVDGFPTFIITGHIGGKKIHKRFNSIEHNDMATKVKKHISEDSDKLVEGSMGGTSGELYASATNETVGMDGVVSDYVSRNGKQLSINEVDGTMEDINKSLIESYVPYTKDSSQYSSPDLSQGVSKMLISDSSMVGSSGKMITVGEDYPKPEDIHKSLLE